MSDGRKERITFDVETSRILQILSSEIYDSPKAFLRENLQNAYDAVLMRCTAESAPLSERRIDVTIDGQTLTVQDDGIGMTEEALKNNFWKAGSSGKKSELAQRLRCHRNLWHWCDGQFRCLRIATRRDAPHRVGHDADQLCVP